MKGALQWGGRFAAPPDEELLRFGSSLEDDLVLAPFDVACSHAHVAALLGGGIIGAEDARALDRALDGVRAEIDGGSFAAFARAGTYEDVHGAIDARVRELAGSAGATLHAGRSRNDQVATTLLLFARDRADAGAGTSVAIARYLLGVARDELDRGTLLAGTTHWQPAQPILLAFWLEAAAEMFARAADRFARARECTRAFCPLGSGALSGSSLPLDRAAAAQLLGFVRPSRNAMDAIGTRDAALDVAHAFVRAIGDASRVSEELVLWCTPAFGYARLGDAASTGSSLMPQKRNPDPFELVRSYAPMLNGLYCGALGSQSGIALSYHRDLQTTKALSVETAQRGLAALRAFDRALRHVAFDGDRMTAAAGVGHTVATDLADALIAGGSTAREAHATIGQRVADADAAGVPLDATFDARASVDAKRTEGSTSSAHVAAAIETLGEQLDALEHSK